MEPVILYDTTLRDGTQGENINFSAEDKLKIAKRLDDIGIHYIEGGWPGSNPKDITFFHAIKKETLQYSKIAAFGSTRRAKVTPAEDNNIQMLIEAEPDTVTIFGKTWLLHVVEVLCVEPDENLRMIEEIREQLKLTSLKYQKLEDMIEAIGLPRERICTHCWDGSSWF